MAIEIASFPIENGGFPQLFWYNQRVSTTATGVVCEVGCMIHRAKKQLQKMTEEWRRQDEAAASSAAEPAAIGAKEEEVGLWTGGSSVIPDSARWGGRDFLKVIPWWVKLLNLTPLIHLRRTGSGSPRLGVRDSKVLATFHGCFCVMPWLPRVNTRWFTSCIFGGCMLSGFVPLPNRSNFHAC